MTPTVTPDHLELSKLGERLESCQDKEDWKSLTIPDDFEADAALKIQGEGLKQVPIKGEHCLRVGTEVDLFQSTGEFPYHGKAFITKIDYLSPGAIGQYLNLSSWDENKLKSFDNKQPSQPLSLVSIDHLIKVYPAKLETEGERLPSCFVGASDWTSWPLKQAEADEFMQNIVDGKMKASFWNGVTNCYRVGRPVQLYIEDNDDYEDLGALIPVALYLVPIDKLTQEHADKIGKSIEALKAALQEKKDRDGGYATIVVWSYQPPQNS